MSDDWSNFRDSFLRRLAEMSSLFRPRAGRAKSEDWAKVADRRSSPVILRLQAGLFLSYQAATRARDSDVFVRDAKTWALFEHAVLPELGNFTFFDKTQDIFISPSAALADGMFHIWTLTDLGLNEQGQPTTIAIIAELAHYLCTVYETARTDRRRKGRNWLGLGSTR